MVKVRCPLLILYATVISVGNSATGAIAGGVAAGAALLFAGPAIVLAYWRRRKPQDHFFDVPGNSIQQYNHLNG